jgi:hypothetical protein
MVTQIGTNVLAFVTILAIVFVLLALSGRGTMTVEAKLDDPHTVEFEDGRRITTAGTTTTYENFTIGREHETLNGVREIGLTINVLRTDRDSRAILGAMIVGWLGAAWVGLHALSRVVAAAAAGSSFADENPARLRRLGAAIIATPLIGVVGTYLLNRTVEADLPISITLVGQSIWLMGLIGLGIFALAEVFAEAARLREFEESTI